MYVKTPVSIYLYQVFKLKQTMIGPSKTNPGGGAPCRKDLESNAPAPAIKVVSRWQPGLVVGATIHIQSDMVHRHCPIQILRSVWQGFQLIKLGTRRAQPLCQFARSFCQNDDSGADAESSNGDIFNHPNPQI